VLIVIFHIKEIYNVVICTRK